MALLTFNVGQKPMATYQHVIWTTRGCWRPDEKRGSWTKLGELYRDLLKDYATMELSHRLPTEWSESPFLPDFVSLSAEECESISDAIRKLTREGGDRVAGNTPIHLLLVQPTSVQMVVSCSPKDLTQKVGRLKSWSSREAEPEFVWGSSFWHSQFYDSSAIRRIEEYLKKEPNQPLQRNASTGSVSNFKSPARRG